MARNINEIREILNDFLKARKKEIEQLKVKIKNIKEEENKSIIDISDSYDNQDVNGYTKATERNKIANATLRMYEKKLKELESTPLIGDEEYRKINKSIKECYKQKSEEIKNKVKNNLVDIEILRDELGLIYSESENALRLLQIDIKKDIPGTHKVLQDGSKLYVQNEQLTYDDVLGCLNYILNLEATKLFMK